MRAYAAEGLVVVILMEVIWIVAKLEARVR
jgi:hypothetical protein